MFPGGNKETEAKPEERFGWMQEKKKKYGWESQIVTKRNIREL